MNVGKALLKIQVASSDPWHSKKFSKKDITQGTVEPAVFCAMSTAEPFATP